jgi:hypothetical protein
MEFAAAALASVASTVSAGASAIGSGIASLSGASFGLTGSTFGATAGGLSSFLPSLSTTASILSGGATVASVLAAQRAGEQKATALEMQAADAETNTQVENVQGIQRRASIKQALLQTIGERDVATAASGVDLSFGTPVTARNQAISDGERALSLDQNTQDFNVARLRQRASNYRMMASDARSGALGTAAGLALEGGAKLLRRG